MMGNHGNVALLSRIASQPQSWHHGLRGAGLVVFHRLLLNLLIVMMVESKDAEGAGVVLAGRFGLSRVGGKIKL